MVVNSWNEWDPLQEVIVGSAHGAVEAAYEPALSPYYTAGNERTEHEVRRVPQELVDAAERQLDSLAELLTNMGIVVRRPDPLDHGISVKSPDWQVVGGHASACPRDVLLVIGNEIIEAPMSQRARYFEFRVYRSLLKEYFRQGAQWTTAPKPLMSNELYNERDQDPFDFNSAPLLTDFEPVFDAACFARFGTDIFWQPDLVSNDFGIEWLRRHLGPKFRIHRIEFRERTPTHIDTTLVPIRPGLVMINPERPCTNGMLELFAENDWQVVTAPPSVRTGPSPAHDVSNWISMNILMLDERTAVVESAETPMMELLRSHGCEVIPCSFNSVYPFGGGLHCCTTDIRRAGVLQSYFPRLDLEIHKDRDLSAKLDEKI